MPTLSAEVLDLGLRLKNQHFTVYIPILFGKENENPRDPILFLRRAFALRADDDWRAGKADVHRPIADQIATLCREEILPRHKGQRLAVIGMCATGSMPLALLAQQPEIREFVAPVVSQPALPLPSWSAAAKKAIGIAPEELRIAQSRVRENHIEILGFRFQCDRISPRERFVALDNAFKIDRHQYFKDCTVPKSEYIDQEKLKKNAHSVLAGCYQPADGQKIPSTEIAWRRLTNFLHAKLDGPAARPYPEKFPDRLLQ
jgi:dienelactone hydrolase